MTPCPPPPPECEPKRQMVDVQALVGDVLAGLSAQLKRQNIETVIDIPQASRVSADREMLGRALMSLARGAAEAMPEGGRLYISAHQCPHGFELEVADSGRGLSDEARRRAFEPFDSIKNNGTEPGLALVYRIAQAHGGTCLAQNCPDGGAAFTLRILTHKLKAAA